MKAVHLQKQSMVIDNIYKEISEWNAEGRFKMFIPHFVYVNDSVKMKLIEDGYKVYKGDWDGVVKDCLIIEW